MIDSPPNSNSEEHGGGRARKRKDALKASEERLRAIVAATAECVKLVAADGTLLEMNQAGLAMVECDSADAVLGQCVYDVIAPEHRAAYREFNERVCRGEGGTLEFDIIGLRGTRRRMETHAVPLCDSDGQLAQLAVSRDVTDRKRAEELLRSSEERHRQLADNLPAGFIYQIIQSAGGAPHFSYASAGVEAILGVSPADIAGNPAVLYRLIVEEDVPHVRAEEEAAARAHRPFDCHFRTRSRSGEIRWLHCRSAPRALCGGFVWDGIAIDITDRKRAEEEREQVLLELVRTSRDLDTLSRSTQQLNHVLEVPVILRTLVASAMQLVSAMSGTAGLLRDGKMVFSEYNEKGNLYPISLTFEREQATGIPSWVMRNRDCYVANDAANDPVIRRDLQQHFDIYNAVVIPLFDRSGTLLACFELINKAGRAAFSDRDISTLRGLAASAAIALENAQLLAQIRDADRRKDEFLAMLAHELRNPLAPVRNALQIMRMPNVPAAALVQAQEMTERQVSHMARLIDDLLEVSRVTRGKIQLKKAPVDLATIVARAVEVTLPVVNARQHELKMSLPREPVRLVADAARLEQVLVNLLTNAAKYTSSGGQILVSAAADADRAVVRVRDTGMGITADLLPRIFDLFVQAEQGPDRTQGGLGIGLTLVKSLVEMHGGSVEARSAGPGKGSEFIVWLPRAVASATPAVPAAVALAPRRAPKRILVVDDNTDAAESLALLLRLQGHEVRTASDGSSALSTAAAFQPHVVFLDIGLPGMDGYEIARRLRTQEDGQRTLLVALTGYGQDEDRRRSTEAGFDHHLVKPADPFHIDRILEHCSS